MGTTRKFKTDFYFLILLFKLLYIYKDIFAFRKAGEATPGDKGGQGYL
jgi:hypothetical protein